MMYSSVMEPILKIMEEKIMGFFSKLFKGPEIDMDPPFHITHNAPPNLVNTADTLPFFS